MSPRRHSLDSRVSRAVCLVIKSINGIMVALDNYEFIESVGLSFAISPG